MSFVCVSSSSSSEFQAQIHIGGAQPMDRGANIALSQPRLPDIVHLLSVSMCAMILRGAVFKSRWHKQFSSSPSPNKSSICFVAITRRS